MKKILALITVFALLALCFCGTAAFAADPIIERMTRPQLEKSIAETTRLMKEAAKRLDFLQAAQYRDEIIRLQKELEMK